MAGARVTVANSEPDAVGTEKLADLIVVDRNPLEDLSALEEVEVVVKGGEVVHAR